MKIRCTKIKGRWIVDKIVSGNPPGFRRYTQRRRVAWDKVGKGSTDEWDDRTRERVGVGNGHGVRKNQVEKNRVGVWTA